jgi:hypothetical protein
MDEHFLVLRREFGGNSGPGNGWAARDEVQIMAAARTEAAARRLQKNLGGWVERAKGPLRKYERNEFLRYC